MAARIEGASYGEHYAPYYDDLFEAREEVDLVVDRLHELAGEQAVLEFGVGTGRLAIPLAQRGHSVFGIDNSAAMLAKLLEKRGSATVEAVLGNFVEVRVDRRISLVYCAFSTIFQLADQRSQLAALRNAAAHLETGGRLVVEFFVHDRNRFVDNQRMEASRVDESGATLKVSLLDAAAQAIYTHSIRVDETGTLTLANRLRFIYPSEFELMARLAGFEVTARWADWRRRQYGSGSGDLIAVCTKVSDCPF